MIHNLVFKYRINRNKMHHKHHYIKFLKLTEKGIVLENQKKQKLFIVCWTDTIKITYTSKIEILIPKMYL